MYEMTVEVILPMGANELTWFMGLQKERNVVREFNPNLYLFLWGKKIQLHSVKVRRQGNSSNI